MILREHADLTVNRHPLVLVNTPTPEPGIEELLIRISACGVCHTELDEIEGRMPPPRLPVILGHQVVGVVDAFGENVKGCYHSERVGVAWINSACGTCRHCREGNDNLCTNFMATGRDVDGGYAEYMTVPQRFAFPLSEGISDIEAAPLLCAGAIGYRSLRLTGLQDGEALGLTGFGASGHLVLKMAKHLYPHSAIYVFARSEEERIFARELGAVWAGDSEEVAPVLLQGIIDTTPVWKPVIEALKNLDSGGRLVINAIRKEDGDKNTLLQLDYPRHLWLEKEIKSVANVSRRDVQEFLALASKISLKPTVEVYPLQEANRALLDLKTKRIRGAKVLVIE